MGKEIKKYFLRNIEFEGPKSLENQGSSLSENGTGKNSFAKSKNHTFPYLFAFFKYIYMLK